jgi:hypothetical protein
VLSFACAFSGSHLLAERGFDIAIGERHNFDPDR